MSTEQNEHSQFTCHWCGFVYPMAERRLIDGKAFCTGNKCRTEYYESTAPGINVDRAQIRALGSTSY